MKTLICLFLVLSACAQAQSGPSEGQGSGTSKTDAVAGSIFDRLSREVAKRSGQPDDANAIGRASLRITFLIDSSQFTAKDFLSLFEKNVAAGFLRRVGIAQLNSKAKENQLDLVSVFPYQLHLVQDPAWSLSDRPLEKGKGVVLSLINKVPVQRVPVPGEGDLGHDSSGARAALIKLLQSDPKDRQDVIIQMSPTSVNSDPTNSANNAKLVQEDARAGLLEGTNFAVYDDDGRYYQTDAPGHGVNASDVHIWIYGPERFTLYPANGSPQSPAQPAAANEPEQTPHTEGPPVALMIFGLVLVAAVVYVLYRMTVKFPIDMDGEIGRAGFTRPLSIIVAGGKTGENSLQISPQKRGMVAEGLKVGEVTVPLLFGAPKISGAGGHTLYVLNSSTSSAPLSKKPVNASFGKADVRTESISFRLR